MTENEDKILETIKEKANELDERASQYEKQLYTVEDEVREIKKTLSYIKHKLGEHDEKIYHLSNFQEQENQNTGFLKEIKRDITYLTEKYVIFRQPTKDQLQQIF